MRRMRPTLHYHPLLDAPSLITPNKETSLTVRQVLNILKTAAETKTLKLGKTIHATLITSNPSSNLQVIENNALLNVYSKCGQLSLAQQLFDEMHKQNVVSWSTLMSAYFHHKRVHKVLQMFKEILNEKDLKPNKYVLSIVLSSCSEGRLLIEGQQCHVYVLKSGLEFHQYVKNSLLRMYSICSDVENATKVLNYIPRSDIFTYNTVINGLLDQGCVNEAKDMLQKLVDECIEWDNNTYVNVFNVCARINSVRLGMQVHNKLLKSNIEVDLYLGSSIIDMYGKCSEILSARKVFDGLKKRNVVSWTAILAAYLQNESFEEALKLYIDMTFESILPNEYTFSVLLYSCANLSSLVCGNSLHSLIQKTGYLNHTIVGNALINMYSRSGYIEASSKIFKEMNYKNIITWNSIISSYAHHGLGREALNIFYEMLACKIPANYVTFVGVLSACGHLGRVDEAFYYLHKLMIDKGIKPGLEHYTCIIGLLGKAGELKQAMEFMNNNPIKWDIIAYRTLLNACYTHRDYNLGNQIAEIILKMNTHDVGTCILLSNMHAKAKRWDNVVKIRKLMRERNIKKEPGMSWTEIKDKTHVFMSDDTNHSDSIQIYRKVKEVLGEIKLVGYIPEIGSDLQDVDEEQKEDSLSYHSEKLAIAYALLKTPEDAPIRVIKNLRMCDDCHSAVKFISKVYNRVIIVRDVNRFHSFCNGNCSCEDYW